MSEQACPAPVLKAHEIKLRYLGTDYYVFAIATNSEEAVRKAKSALQVKTGLQVDFELIDLSQRSSLVAV